MGNPINNAAVFLIQTLFHLYLMVVMLRFILQYNGANFFNPISQFTLKVTNPIINPFRRFIPRLGNIDLAILLILILLQMLALTIIAWLKIDAVPNFFGLMIWSIADLIKLLINIYFYTILIMVIISWINPHSPNPMTEILHIITAPILRPAQRIIPPIGGLDLSPIFVIIALQVILIALINPLTRLGMGLAL